ncbi:MAG: hypothetical protein L3J14_02990 [Flavobacteriaceae bacterium]|nr:hypothetical protein [Flavobacteriaceae bacterium]
MDIHAKKIALTKLLLNTDNASVIQSIKDIFKKVEPSDFWDELSNEEQKEIKQGIKDIEEGKVIDYDTFMVKHR